MAKAKITLEEQVKTLQKHFTAIVVTVKDLKSSVVALQKEVEANKYKEIEEILKSQKDLDEMIKENKKAIRCMDEEFSKVIREKEVIQAQKNTCKGDDGRVEDGKVDDGSKEKRIKRCRYHNRGYCKYKLGCRFTHMAENCDGYLASGKCDTKDCPYRHPKACKWMKISLGCRRGAECEYLHDTIAWGK